jgi:hypothetical protein
MPAPPILDIFVVWHPADEVGGEVFERVHRHFHSEAYSGLAGGAVDVYCRSAGWLAPAGPPRPLPLHGVTEGHVPAAQFSAVVPVLGAGLRDAVESDADWATYLRGVAGATGDTVAVLPVAITGVNLQNSTLYDVIGAIQRLPSGSLADAGLLERSIAQAIAQLASGSTDPLRVFVSHAKHFSNTEEADQAPPVYDQVRSAIAASQLGEFFDAHDLQPGTDWAAELDKYASATALLMVRTDRYASREWTQREVLAAKQHDVPIVGLIALSDGEARGSFLMDHVPTVPLLPDDPNGSIRKALARLVDEALKRALWAAQSTYIRSEGFDWTPVHAPEPVTAVRWLLRHRDEQPADDHLWIIHPDPPLGLSERAVVDDLCVLAGFEARVDILTPRTFAARGGLLHER